ncbi:MAG: hypothetical protein U9N34_10230, partial [Candidatus Cloacimonadota bacterium]|nr:hypothetical protein [Candidatus Cloacimonadota bacterium]
KKKTYLITFLLSFLLSNGIAYYLYVNSFNIFEVDFLKTIKKTKEIATKLDSTFVKKDIPEPILQYNKYYELKKLLNSFMSQDVSAFSQTEIDSLSHFFQGQLDTLATNHQEFIKKINELNRVKFAKIDSLKSLNKEKEFLEDKIKKIDDKKKTETTEEKDKTSVAGIKYLASTYNTMKAESVSGLLAKMDSSKAVKVLQKMNKRKAGKVLAKMPENKAAELTKIIAE